MKRIAFYGGSFDPLHKGHLTIAEKLTEIFALDEFVFVPAFHAPHKKDKNPTSAFYRFAMLCLATNNSEKITVSKMELEVPERPYTIETLTKLKNELRETEIFFVMGADSWMEITTWREWEKVLTIVNIIVVTRPDYEINFAHVTDEIRERIVDIRGEEEKGRKGEREILGISNFKFQISNNEELEDKKRKLNNDGQKIKDEDKNTDDEKIKDEDQRRKIKDQNKSKIKNQKSKIYITDAVNVDISATEIRRSIKENKNDWQTFVPFEVAEFIEKYEIYK